jgi:predicted dienelactone hydrolase
MCVEIGGPFYSVIALIRALQRACVANAFLALFIATSGAAQASFRLPNPSGPFAIGTTSLVVQRKAPEAAPLVVVAWYPASDSAGLTRSPYLREEAALRQLAAFGRNPAATVLQHSSVVTHSWVDAPVRRSTRRLPVLIFSHGYLGMPSDYTALMEDLASHGYAVFSIAHTGESMAVSLPDGRTELLFTPDNQLVPLARGVLGEWTAEDSISAVVISTTVPGRAEETLRWYLAHIPNSTAATYRWVDDTRLVVDELARIVLRPGSRFASRLDLTRLGAFGHSMGGVASAAFCARDRRCDAAINLDGSPQYGDLIDRPSKRPFLMVYSERIFRIGVSDPIYRKGRPYWRAVLSKSGHLNFGDWQYWEPPARMSGALGIIDGVRGGEIVNRLVREFFSAYLDGTRPALFRGERVFDELTVRRLR